MMNNDNSIDHQLEKQKIDNGTKKSWIKNVSAIGIKQKYLSEIFKNPLLESIFSQLTNCKQVDH